MSKTKKRFGALALAAVCLTVAVGVGFAQRQLAGASGYSGQGRPEMKVTLAGEVERAGGRVALDKVENVHPGELLRWQITSVNEGAGAAHDYKAVGQIPRGTAFVAGSAAAEGTSTVTYSIDGGKTYSTQPVVEERQADGTVRRVPAPVSMYTELRYEWSDALAAGGKLSASYKVRVK